MNGGLQENGIHESAEMLSAHVPGHPQGRVDRSRNAEGARYPHSLLEVLSIGKQAEQSSPVVSFAFTWAYLLISDPKLHVLFCR